MKALEATGKFWVPGSENAAQYGHITFDVADGVRLTLANGLIEMLATDSLGAIEALELYRPDIPLRSLSNQALPDTMKKIELRAAMWGAGPQDSQRQAEPHRVLVSFDDLGGIQAVANWLNKAPDLQVIIGSLVTMRTGSVFIENRFLNVSSAAEGFHRSTIGGTHMDTAEFKSVLRMLKKHLPRRYRQWFSTCMAHANDPFLSQRLTELAAQLGPVAEVLVGDVPTWCKVVSRCRNDLTHLDGQRKIYNGSDLHWAAEGTFNVTRLCIFLHVGMNPGRPTQLDKSWAVTSAADYVRKAVNRLVDAQQSSKTTTAEPV
ncbi:hypothetical protein DQ384_36775 [Sphaerisporangium album]|uniref:Apea-like HEPN domain-containing protein n=1 Tax=Sphaerisporangium album TaxID=509200 RepID=A0A367EUU0_9ACTN|nr:HEPN domain-containing protein [Sphaerisporangium album]RCG21167.1 hypothetical protein DQ384_36775 [Sphaerisporangium album]